MDSSTIYTKLYGDELIPTSLNTTTCQQYIKIHHDKLTAEYIGRGIHTDPGSVKSNISAPTNCILYYYEIEILECGSTCKVVVGFTSPNYHLNKVPGSEQGSIGYKAEDGTKLCGTIRQDSFGPTYTKGDIIGVGMNYISKSYFFVKNGVFIGYAGNIGQSENYPTIGLNVDEKVKVNFTGPFQYDILSLYQAEIDNSRKEMEVHVIAKDQLDHIVRCYLIYKGYSETLNTFNKETNFDESKMIEDKSSLYLKDFYITDRDIEIQLSTMNVRNNISQYILNGNILGAIDIINSNYPLILDQISTTSLLLYTQHMIELIKNGFIDKAISWSQEHLTPFLSKDAPNEIKEVLEQSCGLFAYEDIDKCTLSWEVGCKRRIHTCNAVNESILEHLGVKKKPGLCTIIQNLSVLRAMQREQNNNKGPVFIPKNLQDIFRI